MYDTIETAQARILELEEELNTVKSERDSLSENNNSLTARVEELRSQNQTYFNKLLAQKEEPNKEDEREEEIPTCEEFAKSIKI